MQAQGGDITHEDGTGGESIYGPTFEDESLLGSHDSAGVSDLFDSVQVRIAVVNCSHFWLESVPLISAMSML